MSFTTTFLTKVPPPAIYSGPITDFNTCTTRGLRLHENIGNPIPLNCPPCILNNKLQAGILKVSTSEDGRHIHQKYTVTQYFNWVQDRYAGIEYSRSRFSWPDLDGTIITKWGIWREKSIADIAENSTEIISRVLGDLHVKRFIY